MTSLNPYQFGVEIELLLGGRWKNHRTWNSLAQDLSTRLQRAGISNHINTGNDRSPANYQEWSIVPEITVPSQPVRCLWGIELVSPVYPINFNWTVDLTTIFTTLTRGFKIHPSSHAATHVHISSIPVPLGVTELTSLSKAVVYYESALDLLVPPARRASSTYWCQSNRSNPTLKRCARLADCLATIDRAADTTQVVEAMNLVPADSPYGIAHGYQNDFIRGRVYKWDLSRMLAGEQGTVEFRQAPGSTTAAEVTAWVTLAVAFVAGAVEYGGGVGEGEEGGSDGELWELLTDGAGVLGWEGLGGVEGLFARRGSR